MADTTVKFFHWQMTGAPSLSGAAGGIIGVLDACLVNGFGLGTLDSLVIASGVATATRSGGHSAVVDGVETLAGITGTYAGLNGERKVTFTSATTYKFDATGYPDGTATGTITTKVSPLGYAKSFSGTNKAAYKPTDVTALGMYLRVDDTTTKSAGVKGYETMSDVDTGTGLFQTQTGGLWSKSATTDSTARPWAIIGDSRAFYFWCEPNVTTGGGVTSQGQLWFSGDIIPRRSSDAYAHMLYAVGSDVTNTNTAFNDPFNLAINPSENYKVPRSQTGLGAAQTAGYYAASRKLTAAGTTCSGKGAQFYPNAADNGVDFDEAILTDQDNDSVRGRMPGIYLMPQAVEFAFATLDRLAGGGDLVSKNLLFMRVGSSNAVTQNSTSGRYGVGAFDITGPWR